MPIPARIRSWWRNLIQRSQVEQELDEEVRSYIEQLVEKNIRQGMTPVEARRAAGITLGSVEQVKEQVREVRTGVWIASLIQDLRYGVRQLRRNPGFAALAVITLALGIGATTAIFSVVSAVVLRPLPFRAPDQLVQVTASGRQRTLSQTGASYLDFLDWRKQNSVFTGMAAYSKTFFTLIGRGQADFIYGTAATPSLFSILGAKPLLGRTYTWKEERTQGAPVVMISEHLWRQRYAASPAIIGKSIDLNKKGFTVVGVVPSGFRFPFESHRSDIWVPVTQDPTFGVLSPIREAHYLHVTARLKSGTTLSAAQAQMDTILDRLARTYPKADAGWHAGLAPLQRKIVGGVEDPLMILLAAVAFVVLIACVNVANLLLARALSREKEFAVRAALGASRRRLARQVLLESSLLSFLGGAVGLFVAFESMGALSSLVPADVPRVHSFGITAWVLGFTVGLCVVVGLLSGLGAALHRPQTGLNEALKEGARAAGGSGRQRGLRSVLVISEIALAVVLLAGAGLLIRSLVGLESVDPGFNPHNLLEASISLPRAQYRRPGQWTEFYSQLIGRLKVLPGVIGAGATLVPPLSGGVVPMQFTIEGRPAPNPGKFPSANYSDVSAGYFRLMQTPLVRGRFFTQSDRFSAPAVAIVNQAFARRYFPNQDPLGQTILIRYPLLNLRTREIVGIVGDVRFRSLGEPAPPTIYTPYRQAAFAVIRVVVRTAGNPLLAVSAVRAQLAQIDPTIPLSAVTTALRAERETLSQPRFRTLLLGAFAGLALLLATIGIFGVISYSIGQRTHEMGIRMALGARRQDVLKLVVGQGMTLAVIGVSLGIGASLGLTRFLARMLYGVKPADPLTFIVVALILMGVALLACYIPARRATKVDPIVALRYE
jgi:predicted permease